MPSVPGKFLYSSDRTEWGKFSVIITVSSLAGRTGGEFLLSFLFCLVRGCIQIAYNKKNLGRL